MANPRVIRIELDGFEEGDFEVVSFSGTEAVSHLFEYTVTLVSKKPIHNFDDMLEAKAHLIFGDPEVHIRGILCSVEQGYDAAWAQDSGRLTRFEVVLVPALWKLSLFSRTRFFRDMSAVDIIQDVIQEHGLTVELSCSGSHPVRKSVLQYQETDLDFVQRLAEKEGIHYHHVHSDSEEALIFGDANAAFGPVTGDSDLPLKNPKMLEGKQARGAWDWEQTILKFQSRQRFIPKQIVLQDYNYLTPSADLRVKDEASTKAAEGVQYMFAENYLDTGEGDSLKKLRKEGLLAGKRAFMGTSNVHRMFAGATFKLSGVDSIDTELAQEYLITEFKSEGSQPIEHDPGAESFNYSNTFTCIPTAVVFRPELRTPKPQMVGLFAGKIATGKDYADPEEQGRYQVQFAFDLDGKSSIPVRLMEPYVGADYGFHAPLHVGVEVQVGFEYGDPDRPIIVAPAYNPDFPNPVTGSNHAQSIFRSAGNNELRFDDTQGSEHVFLHGQKDWQIRIENDKTQNIGNDETLDVVGNRNKTTGKDQTETIGNNKTTQVGANHAETIGANQSIDIGASKAETVATASSETVGAAKTTSVGAAYQISVGAAMNTTVGAAKGTEVGGAQTVVIGGNSNETVGKARKVVVKDNSSQEVGKEYSLKAKKKLIIESDEEITLKAGSASITLKKDGTIVIDGKDVSVKASGAFAAKASKDVTLKGSKVLAN